jgi:hypothetical protein
MVVKHHQKLLVVGWMRGIVEMVNQCVMWRVVSNDNSPTPSALFSCCLTLRSAVCAYRRLRLAQVFEIIEQLLTASAIIIRRSPVRIREEPPNTAHCSCSSGLFCCHKHTCAHSQHTFADPVWTLGDCLAEGVYGCVDRSQWLPGGGDCL